MFITITICEKESYTHGTEISIDSSKTAGDLIVAYRNKLLHSNRLRRNWLWDGSDDDLSSDPDSDSDLNPTRSDIKLSLKQGTLALEEKETLENNGIRSNCRLVLVKTRMCPKVQEAKGPSVTGVFGSSLKQPLLVENLEIDTPSASPKTNCCICM